MNRNVIGTILDELVDVCWFFLPVCQHWSTVRRDDDLRQLIDTGRQGTLSKDSFVRQQTQLELDTLMYWQPVQLSECNQTGGHDFNKW